MTTNSCKNGATTVFRVNFSGYSAHVKSYSTVECQLDVLCVVLFSSVATFRVRLRLLVG